MATKAVTVKCPLMEQTLSQITYWLCAPWHEHLLQTEQRCMKKVLWLGCVSISLLRLWRVLPAA